MGETAIGYWTDANEYVVCDAGSIGPAYEWRYLACHRQCGLAFSVLGEGSSQKPLASGGVERTGKLGKFNTVNGACSICRRGGSRMGCVPPLQAGLAVRTSTIVVSSGEVMASEA